MADTPKVYVLCDANCRWEGMTKEQILTAITQAVNEGTISNIDTGFVQTIKTVNGKGLKFFVGEQSEYDALTQEDKEDLFAIISNDVAKDDLLNAIETVKLGFEDLMSGNSAAPFADKAVRADIATALNPTKGTLSMSAGYAEITLEENAIYVFSISGTSETADYRSANGSTVILSTYCYDSQNQCFSSPYSNGTDTYVLMYDKDKREGVYNPRIYLRTFETHSNVSGSMTLTYARIA